MSHHANFVNIEQKLIQDIKTWTEETLIGDDCACLPGQNLVTSDTLVEGNHFRFPLINYSDLGWKAMAVNLSDIAAMAGYPRYAVVCLTLPEETSRSNIELLYKTLVKCASTYKTRIVGGDLTSGPALSITVTIIGENHENGCLKRSGAKAGDIIAVTGDFGASAAGLIALKKSLSEYTHCINKHIHPIPRLSESWTLVKQSSNRGALMDASDGLADALLQIAAASNVGIAISEKLIPIHSQTKQIAELAKTSALDLALYGGEDYELVACIDPVNWKALQESKNNPFQQIGIVTNDKSVLISLANQTTVTIDAAKTYQHWQ